MAKYDVHELGEGLVLNVQSDILDSIKTKMVIPLMPLETYSLTASRLNPRFEINETNYILLTQSMSSVPVKSLGQPVANLSDHFSEITNALDMLFYGF